MTSFSPARARHTLAAAVVPFVPVIGLIAATPAPAQPAPDTVVVTANRTAQPLSSVLADFSVVDRAAIESSGAVAVADLLARLPGIEISRSGGPAATTGVFIRGAENRHTAVFIDGVRVDSQAVGGALWEQIPLEQIDRIEVLRGPAAAIYGSDAVGGVVQLFTRRGQGAARPWASLVAGSYGTAQLQAGISGAAQGLDYSLSAAHGRSDGFDSRTPAAGAHSEDDDGWRRSSLQARAGWQFDAVHRIDASLLASRLKAQYDGFTPGFDDWSEQSLRSGSLAWQGRWNNQASTRLQFGQTDSTYESRPDFYRTETTLRNLTLQHEQRLGRNLVTATLERREDELLNPATAYTATLQGKRHQDAVALGWRGDFGADREHGLQAHLRHDDDSEFGGKTTGSLAWGWAFVPQWRLTASAATSFRAPTLYQRFSAYGNPALVPESGRNVELALRWTPAAASEASLTAWRNKVSQLIAFGPPGPCADLYGCYVNVGRAELKGATLAGRTQVAGVTLRGSLDWHDPRNADTDKILPRRARRLATLGAEAPLAGWTLGAEVQAAGRRYENAANTQPLGGYALVNLYASTRLTAGLSLQARIDNAGDKAYELARAYASAGRSAQLALRWTPP
ncbi:MAG: TonB-dependent receptor [Proteobacteria bacterium]|nr:TonB-dependent receptor [Pseudomonadota bacterium]